MKSSSNGMKRVYIWTDGSCLGNPGAGGWAAVLIHKDVMKIIGGYIPHATNNQMELLASVEAMTTLKEPCSVFLSTDSQYLVYGYNRIFRGSKLLKTNPSLWAKARSLCETNRLHIEKVIGHSNDWFNATADKIALHCASTGRSFQNQFSLTWVTEQINEYGLRHFTGTLLWRR